MHPANRNMFSALLAMESAALTASIATAGRYAEFASSRAEAAATTALEAWLAPAGARQRAVENALQRVWEYDVEAATVMAGLPRLWLMLFLSELDRVRGSRAIPGPNRPA